MGTFSCQSGAVSGPLGLDTAMLVWFAGARARCEATKDARAGLDPTDARDVRLSLRGDDEAFTRLVRRYQADVGRWMWRFTRDREEHVELVQEVFIAAFTSLRTYRGRGPFGRWLHAIAIRAGYAFWRRERRRAEPRDDIDQLLDLQAQEDSPECAVTAGAAVHGILAQLRPRDRLVLTLLYLDELSGAEAAEVTGWSQTMVKVQAWRAKQKLRKLLEAPGEPESEARS